MKCHIIRMTGNSPRGRKRMETLNKNSIEYEVSETLHSLDNFPEIKADPYFTARFRQRFVRNSKHNIHRLVFTSFLILVCILSGVFIGLNYPMDRKRDHVDMIVDMYGLETPDMNIMFSNSGNY